MMPHPTPTQQKIIRLLRQSGETNTTLRFIHARRAPLAAAIRLETPRITENREPR